MASASRSEPNWAPSRRLEDHGVEFVFLTTGNAEENRAVFDEAGLHARVLFVETQMPEVFGAVGTPSAYLVDSEGRAGLPTHDRRGARSPHWHVRRQDGRSLSPSGEFSYHPDGLVWVARFEPI